MSAKRLGWDISHPWLWVTDAGIQFSLLTTSPRLMAWHIKQSWTRLVSQRVASKLVANGYDAPTGAIDFTTPRQVIESRATDALTPLQKGALRAVACDAVWPKDRLIKEGYLVDPFCELCKKHPDSMFHRIWECDCPDAVQARTSIAPPHLVREALARGPTCAAFTRGLGPDLSKYMEPPVNNGGIKYTRNGCEVADRQLWTLHGDVSTTAPASNAALLA